MPDDNDARVLEDTADAVTVIDLKYRAADVNGRLALKPQRDAAFNAYSAARLKLLADGVVCTDADVAEMHTLCDQVRQAADTQTLVMGIAKFVAMLVRIAAA